MSQGSLGLILQRVRKLVQSSADNQAPDRELLQRFAEQRDEVAFRSLVERHGPMVLGLCYRTLGHAQDTEDAFQATFLVLARRARSVRWQESLANWLYEVAQRTAWKARAKAVRRQAREKEAAHMATRKSDSAESAGPSNDPTTESNRRELGAVLDDELRRLPAKYRTVLVLCYLQGKTHAQAARELGWPSGSVSRHIERARQLLHRRLTARGLTLSAGLVGTFLTENVAPAALHSALVLSTVRTALLFATGYSTAATATSPAALTLAEGVMKTMAIHRAALMIAVVLSLGGLSWAALTGVGNQLPTPAHQTNLAHIAAEVAKEPEAGDAGQGKNNPEKPKAPVPERDRLQQAREMLARRVNLDNGIPPNTPLAEALAFLADRYDATILIDNKAFEDIGVLRVEEQPISLPKMRDARMSTVLWYLLGQLKGDGRTGGYLVRPGFIEVTTRPERANQPLVQLSVRGRPLEEVLRDLSESEGVNIVIDVRVVEKARSPVSATYTNVELETAVRLLADMADLKTVHVENVLYVTSKGNADVLRAEEEQRKSKGVEKKARTGETGRSKKE